MKRATKILVVDDNQRAADTLGKLLEAKGYAVATVYDGESALAIAKEIYPDAILLDLNLPGKSGYEIARELKRDSYSKQPLLIALSGYGQREHKQMARDAGFDHHLTKPVLVAEIEELLNGSKGKTKTGAISSE